MNIDKAYEKMANLMLEEMIFHRKFIKPSSSFKDLPVDTLREWDLLKARTKSYGEELAGSPGIYPLLKQFMVDVVGSQSELGPKDMKNTLQNHNFKDLIERAGGLAQAIQKQVEKWGFRITDRGGGCGSWHIGVPCNQGEADRLCALCHINFRRAIDKGYIKIIRHFWQYRLPGLYNWDEVEQYFKSRKQQGGE